MRPKQPGGRLDGQAQAPVFLAQGGNDQVAERVSLKSGAGGEPMLKKFGELERVGGQRRKAIAQVADRGNAESPAQPPTGAAVVGRADDRRNADPCGMGGDGPSGSCANSFSPASRTGNPVPPPIPSIFLIACSPSLILGAHASCVPPPRTMKPQMNTEQPGRNQKKSRREDTKKSFAILRVFVSLR